MQIFLYPHVQTTEGQPERLSPRRGRTTSRQVARMQQQKTVKNFDKFAADAHAAHHSVQVIPIPTTGRKENEHSK
jgi:hypothetical protein